MSHHDSQLLGTQFGPYAATVVDKGWVTTITYTLTNDRHEQVSNVRNDMRNFQRRLVLTVPSDNCTSTAFQRLFFVITKLNTTSARHV